MQLTINNITYKVINDTIFVHHSNPLPLTYLKPTYRKQGNTIGRIPIPFLLGEHFVQTPNN